MRSFRISSHAGEIFPDLLPRSLLCAGQTIWKLSQKIIGKRHIFHGTLVDQKVIFPLPLPDPQYEFKKFIEDQPVPGFGQGLHVRGMMDAAQRLIPAAELQFVPFLPAQIILERGKLLQGLSDQGCHLLVLHALKQRIDRLQRSLQIMIVVERIHSRLFHIIKAPGSLFHDTHKDSLTPGRKIPGHIGHVVESDPAVAGGVSRFEMRDRPLSGPDIGTSSDHSQKDGAVLPLLRLRDSGQRCILLVPHGIMVDKVRYRVDPMVREKFSGFRSYSLQFSYFCLQIHP